MLGSFCLLYVFYIWLSLILMHDGIFCQGPSSLRIRTVLSPIQSTVYSTIMTVGIETRHRPATSDHTWALGRHLLRLLGRPEEDRLTRWAAAAHADALHVNDVLRVLIQVPQCTGARGGVHLLDEPPHADILLLRANKRGPAAKNVTGALIGAQSLESVAAEISPPSNAKKIKVDSTLRSVSKSADLWRKSFVRFKADTK